jgi:UDP-N-acetylmuramate--alanine ligase
VVIVHSSPTKKIHFIGIGGIGMSGIAEVLLALGHKVSGSDSVSSANTEKLKSLGAEIFIGHSHENVKDTKLIVFSSAVKENNPEMVEAKKNNLPVMRRAEMLAELMRLKNGFAIAGTHGKTSTTSFLATILQECDLEPTYVIGGIVANLQGHAKVGKGDLMVVEADESDGSFLLYNPVMSVITNIDNDHLDHYGTFENLVEAYRQFSNKVPFYGLCAINAHDIHLHKISTQMTKPWTTFGIDDGTAFLPLAYMAKDIIFEKNQTTFDFYIEEKKVGRVKIQLLGRHNVLNALGAMTLACQLKLPVDKIIKAISKFEGVGRRIQTIFEKDGFKVIDDYGHHPTEVLTVLSTIRQLNLEKKLVVFFEPHRYSRTKSCWQEFQKCFDSADKLYLLPIYAASETPIEGITSESMAHEINIKKENFVTVLKDYDGLKQSVIDCQNKDTIVVAMGAGTIGKKIREAIQDL